MESSSSAAESGRSSASVVESLNRGKEAIGTAANQAKDAAATDLESLRKDLNGLRETVTTFISEAGAEAGKSARDVSSALAEQGVNMASSAAERSRSLVGDLEQMARRNPVATLVGGVVLGMVLATLNRRH